MTNGPYFANGEMNEIVILLAKEMARAFYTTLIENCRLYIHLNEA